MFSYSRPNVLSIFIMLNKIIFAVITFILQINFNFCETYDRSGRGYTSVPTDIPSGMRFIIFTNNDLSLINDESFNETSTDFSNVHTLHLGENKIKNVSKRAFVGFLNAKGLVLEYNRLTDISLEAKDIPQLLNLYLRYNRLNKIPTFHGVFQYIRTLHLASNLISHICKHDFENITNVETIVLSDNVLISFEPEHELVRLGYLYLSYNKLTEVPSLKGTYNSIQKIHVGNNKITVQSFLMLKEKINGSEQSLTELFMGGNADLSNDLPVVINFLRQFPKLQNVDLSYSNINKIFHLTNSLERLDLTHNSISEITKEDFIIGNQHTSFTVFLDDNPIETLPNLYEYLKDFNSSKTEIYLRDIGFNCGNLCWMTEIG